MRLNSAPTAHQVKVKVLGVTVICAGKANAPAQRSIEAEVGVMLKIREMHFPMESFHTLVVKQHDKRSSVSVKNMYNIRVSR
jgi:mitochondrial fission protein ELM1